MIIANTFFRNPDSRRVTYRELSTPHSISLEQDWNCDSYNIIDHCLVNRRWRNIVQAIHTYPECSLSTRSGQGGHLFLAIATLKLTVGAKAPVPHPPPTYEFAAVTE